MFYFTFKTAFLLRQSSASNLLSHLQLHEVQVLLCVPGHASAVQENESKDRGWNRTETFCLVPWQLYVVDESTVLCNWKGTESYFPSRCSWWRDAPLCGLPKDVFISRFINMLLCNSHSHCLASLLQCFLQPHFRKPTLT